MNAYQTLLPAGSHWSLVMRSGTALTLTDIEGGANVGMLFYNPEICWSATTRPIR